MYTKNHLSAHLLNSLPSLHYKRFKAIVEHFSDFQTAWEKLSADELQASGLKLEVAQRLWQEKQAINPEQEYKKLQALNLRLVTGDDPEYPLLLKEIYDPPFILYLQGRPLPKDNLCLALVGSRRCSLYGKQVTDQIVRALAPFKTNIVSGLAFGIDSVAHQAALKNNCFTIAVCAFGLHHLYPPANGRLADQIKEHGVLMSEFPLNKKPEPYCFPLRNRIISGLSVATVVIEAAEKSGALITAQSALDQGREVFAVPGDITRQTSLGPNKLIRDGQAIGLVQPQDILEKLSGNSLGGKAINAVFTGNLPALNLSPDEQQIYNLLETNLHIDDLIRQTVLSSSTVSSLLTKMELKGLVKNWGGMVYGKNV